MSDDPKLTATPGLLRTSRRDVTNSGSTLPERVSGVPVIDDAIFRLLKDAMLMPDLQRADDTLESIREGLGSVEPLIDFYIPAVAREFGERWCADSLSFAEVTIGTARLQSWVRDLDRSCQRRDVDDLDNPAVLMVIPKDMYHTLGGMVVVSQFRRLGVSVSLELGPSPDQLAQRVRNGGYDMVAFSASSCESLEMLRLLVNKVREGGHPAPPVVVGGSLVDAEPDAKILTGADFATSSAREALQLCGLKMLKTETHYNETKA